MMYLNDLNINKYIIIILKYDVGRTISAVVAPAT